MHRASDTIGTIAAALAKAQTELANPEKSLTATIRLQNGRQPEQRFRYAPLASGLDIVRKSLGKHEIATIQTTAIDKESGLVRLTTILAHSSGEWISSDWPVCPICDTTEPHRMGAALTYARRYALFTLVGIAGEDDLDAPDLPAANKIERNDANPIAKERKANSPATEMANSHGRRSLAHPSRAALAPDASATIRDQLLAEISKLSVLDRLTEWAHRSLPAKHMLTAADARIVEQAFQTRIALVDGVIEMPAPIDQLGEQATLNTNAESCARKLPIEKLRRKRNKAHITFVSSQPCLVCGRSPSDAHHLRFVQPRALGRKVSDEFTVPLCRVHHRELHRHGNELAWWQHTKIDPVAVSRVLWQNSQGDEPPTEIAPASNKTESF